jgi:pyochelin synthetase
VLTERSRYSYAQLHQHSERIAARLRRAGVRPGDLVAVALSKGADQPAAVLGTLRAGGAYVPIDPQWPASRIRHLLTDTRARAVLTSADFQAGLAGLTDAAVIDTAEATAGDAPDCDVEVEAAGATARRPEDLAYVIYTSGSTGHPKGAMLDHRGPLNTILDLNERFGVGPHDVVFGVSSLCFDLSVYDIFGTLAAGATLVLPTGAQSDPASWLDLVHSHQVTVWNSVPALMQLFVEEAVATGARFPALRTVLLSGDWIPVTLPGRIREIAPNARVISLGGATEASIWSIFYPIDETDPAWTSIPYGRPLTNQTWHVLDDLGRDAPVWVPGHLFIGGAGVALGYLNDPDRTAAAFVRHPRTGERLYRTGDLGRYLPDGDIEFLGRADFQVKIQGFRVEPGEIEHSLLEHPAVAGAAVVARQSGSGKQLVAFVTGPDGGTRPEPAALRAFLTDRLPGYLVPHHITALDRLPLTSNGKLDRRALDGLSLGNEDDDRRYVAATTPVEADLVEIWETVLSTTPIGVRDDFFELGGQSFAALRVISLIAERLHRRIPLGVLLERRTITGLAGWLDAAERDWTPLVRLHDGSVRPWFFVHPAGGNVVCYRALAGRTRRGLHGFQAPGPAAGRPPLEKVEDLANEYLRSLLGEHPHGPYRLGGWSSGAVIALELARQLAERGEPVRRLVVLDAPAPVAPREVTEAQLLHWFLDDLEPGAGGRLRPHEAAELVTLPQPERLARLLALLDGDGAELDLADLADALAVFRGVVRACNRYQVHGPIGADITVLRATRGTVPEFTGHPDTERPDWGWGAVTTGTVDVITVDGTHHTLLTNDAALAIVAGALNNR